MPASTAAATRLEFVVLGAQKAGTTTLWTLLRDHPQLWVPATKEAPLFVRELGRGDLGSALERLGAPADGVRVRGKVTPHYLHGVPGCSTAQIAARIARWLPDVRLVALLRDPIARARSQHAMNRARGRDERTFAEAIDACLSPQGLLRGRSDPATDSTYVAQGEYARLVSEQLAHHPRSALLVLWTADLDRDPGGTLARTLTFLGVDSGFRPHDLQVRSFVGGDAPRLSEPTAEQLVADVLEAPANRRRFVARAALEEHGVDDVGTEQLLDLVARLGLEADPLPATVRDGLRWQVTKVWNVRPGPPPPLDAQTARRLAEHFLADAQHLARLVGEQPPWTSDLEALAAGTATTGASAR